MKKIFILLILCMICVGCGKEENNITINVYENTNSAKEDVQDIEVEEVMDTNINNGVDKETIIKEESNSATSTKSNADINTSKISENVSKAKEWYDENKDELKEISTDIVNEDKETITEMVDSVKNWYSENKDDLTDTATEIYNNDKETILGLYDKMKN